MSDEQDVATIRFSKMMQTLKVLDLVTNYPGSVWSNSLTPDEQVESYFTGEYDFFMNSKKRSSGPRQIVLIGGGHSHVQFLRLWQESKISNVDVTLISYPALSPYSGMLPGFLAGWYRKEEMHFDLEQLCAQAGVKFACTEVERLDPFKKEVRTRDGGVYSYDVASMNIGVTPVLPNGGQNHPGVTAIKPIAQLLCKWERLIQSSARRWLIVGGGGSGFELGVILAMKKPEAEITLVHSGEDILPTHNRLVRQRARECLMNRGVRVLTGQTLVTVEGHWAVTQAGERLAFDEMLVTTGARAADWLRESGLPVDANGFVRVDCYLQVKGCPGLFAAGDCAHFEDQPLPKSGVYAVRQGPPLIHNIIAFVKDGRPSRRYHPQRRTLALFTSGDKRALLSYGPLTWESGWLWRWKDHIDRRFMRSFGWR